MSISRHGSTSDPPSMPSAQFKHSLCTITKSDINFMTVKIQPQLRHGLVMPPSKKINILEMVKLKQKT